MRIPELTGIVFCGQPGNYGVVDRQISRSAQPQRDDFVWLREHGVTDVFNFRTMVKPDLDFDEKSVVEQLGMKYHNIPTSSRHPSEEKVIQFLKEADDIIKTGGKAHIHCKAGADRTGMYSYIYKAIKGIGNRSDNVIEMLKMGHNQKLYPDMISWADTVIEKIFKNVR